MTTSGTVATTVLDNSIVVEHAVRRCGLSSAAQTPEMVDIAKQNLYLLLLNLANRGLNLWCVERELMGLSTGQATYTLPPGTLRLLNVIYSSSTRVTGTDTVTSTSYSTLLATPTTVVRYGFKTAAMVGGGTLNIFYGDNQSLTFLAAHTIEAGDFAWHWFDVDPTLTALQWMASYSGPDQGPGNVISNLYLASSIADLPMTQFNRDEWSQQVNKYNTGRPATNFYFDKQVEPTITLWPLPNNDYDQLSVWRHRFVQDVGTLTQQIEVPQQWMEAVIWMLAARLAYELPGVDPARRTEVIQASERFLADAELSETDNAPIYLFSNVDVYTA